ncbi:MAG TPA: hypothetical protein VIV12_11285, partial [Streptosporangiaceae bacterium]
MTTAGTAGEAGPGTRARPATPAGDAAAAARLRTRVGAIPAHGLRQSKAAPRGDGDVVASAGGDRAQRLEIAVGAERAVTQRGRTLVEEHRVDALHPGGVL